MKKRNKTIAAVTTAVGAAAIWAGVAVIPSAMASEAPADQPGVEAPAQDHGSGTVVTLSGTALLADEGAAIPADAVTVTVDTAGGFHSSAIAVPAPSTDMANLVPITDAP